MQNAYMNIDVFILYSFCLYAECDSVNQCIYSYIHAAIERAPILMCNVTCGTDLMYKKSIKMHGDTFVFQF